MSRPPLTTLQWRLSLFGAAAAALAALLTLIATAGALQLDPFTLLTLRWLGLPVLLLILLLALPAGLLAGYRYGSRVHRRLDQLVEAVRHYERGDFGYPVPPPGDDEIGRLAQHLGAMATQVGQHAASLQRLATQQAEMREQVRQAAVTEERQRLARELHDAVSQQLFAISMLSSAVIEQVPDEQAPLRQQLAAIETMAGRAQTEMRALLMHLRPAVLEGKGLKEGLDDLLEAFRQRHPIEVRWEVGALPPLPRGVEDHLFRIVQEALSNVLRHAQARRVTVRLGVAQRQVRLKIVDDGVGFDPGRARSASYGLQVIAERASEIGGVASVVSVPGRGTQVEVTVPLVGDPGERAE